MSLQPDLKNLKHGFLIGAILLAPMTGFTDLKSAQKGPKPDQQIKVIAHEGSTASQTEIKVTLFGQPCLLKGPYPSQLLKSIHQLGPEAVYIDLYSSHALKQATLVLSQISNIPGLSPTIEQALSPYRKKLTARIEAFIAYLNGLEKLKNTHDPKEFLKAVSGHLKGDRSGELEKMAAHLAQAKKFDENLDEFFEAYNQQIEPDPENDFHRAIKQLDIRYHCAFDNFTEDK